MLLVSFASGLVFSATNGPLSRFANAGPAGNQFVTTVTGPALTTITGPALTTVTGPASTTVTPPPKPRILVFPSPGRANSNESFSASGFDPNVVLNVTMRSLSNSTLVYTLSSSSGGQFVTNSDGNLLSSFRVPSALVGNYTIFAKDPLDLNSSTLFTVR